MIKENEKGKKRRKEERISVALPMNLGNTQYVTHDISPSGVYFEAEESFDVGGRINFVVEFINSVGSLKLKCHGEIVRVENHNGKKGVAVRIVESVMESA